MGRSEPVAWNTVSPAGDLTARVQAEALSEGLPS
jgi:hypothetical protein